jgi:HlyD family secretion protein
VSASRGTLAGQRGTGLALVAVLSALAAFAAGAWMMAGRSGNGGAGDWVEVGREDLVIGVPVTGQLGAIDSAQVGPPPIKDTWDYKIAFLAPEGALVRQGDPVVAFDSTLLQNSLRDKMVERDTAEKDLEKKRTDLEIARHDDELKLAEAEAARRKDALKVDVPAELVNRNELKAAHTDLALDERQIAYLQQRLQLESRGATAEMEALRARRDRAAARVAEVQEAIASMRVRAPRAGTVVYVAGRRGVKKKVGDSCWRMEKVLEIPDLTRMKAEAEVDEADAGRVASGQAVQLRLDAHPDLIFSGRVQEIHGAVETRSSASPEKVVRLVVAIDNTDAQRMRPGMRVRGEIETERAAKVLAAPVEAVFNQPRGAVVYRRTRWGVETVQPRLGRRNERLVEVLGGLAAGDWLARRAPGGTGAESRGGSR